MNRFIILITLVFTLVASARDWTATDGRKLSADFVSAAAGQVTLKRTDTGQIVNFPLSRLSAEDQAFVTNQQTLPSGSQPKPVSGPFAALVQGKWELSEHRGLPFALYAAKDLDAAKTYPLIITLHGKSQNNDNGMQTGGWAGSFTKAERYAKHPCIVLAPLCYQPFGDTGRGWQDKPGEQTLILVKELIKSLPVDKTRIYCTGHSMGGFGVCHLISQEPRLFAAGVAVAGCLPEAVGAFRQVPLSWFHAADDTVVKVESSRILARTLKSSKTCRYTEYPSGGHLIASQVFEDESLHDWLFAQHKHR